MNIDQIKRNIIHGRVSSRQLFLNARRNVIILVRFFFLHHCIVSDRKPSPIRQQLSPETYRSYYYY